ncbi:MAG: ATP-binding protein [Flavobacteriaceae bacterium]|nr:ATP-binding protein [Flavobacteriaceae bacterium]
MYHKQLVLLTALTFIFLSGFSQTREIDSLTIQLTFQDQDSLKVDTSIKLINALIENKEYVKAIQYLNKSEKLAKDLNYISGLASLNLFNAQIYLKNKDYKNVISSYNKSLHYYSKSNDSLGLANVYQKLGVLYLELGNYSKGLDLSISAIEILKKYNLKKQLGELYNKIAEAYFNTNEIEKSLLYNQKSLDISKELNNIDGIIFSTISIANIYSIKKEHRKSIEYYENALTFLKLSENENFRCEILPNIGREYLRFNEFTLASKYLIEAITLNKKQNNKKGIIISYTYLSELNLKLNKSRLASYQINEAYKLINQIDDDELKLETLRVLIKVHSANSDYKAAFNRQSEYYELKTRLDLEKDKNFFSNIPKEPSIEKPKIDDENVSESLQDENKTNLEIKKLKLFIYGLLALVFILLISLFFLTKSNKRKLKYISNFKSDNENAELKEKLNNLEDMNQVKNRLFSIVSHDLKDSISSIKSFIDLLNNKDISKSEFKQLLPELSENADNASTLLLNLLSWSKSQMDNLDPKAEIFDIKEVIREKLNLIKEKVAKKRIVVIDESVKEMVYADRNMIEIVIQNLLANAVKFSRVGDVITVTNRQKNDKSLICVADTGVGISEENQKKLFSNEGFTTRGTDQEKGTGLGLSICKQLVDLNNGKIWVESEPNLGSKFYIELPKKS